MGNIRTVTLRGVEIGAGIPKIIVPVAAKTKDAILEKAREIMDCEFDCVEWRVDFYEAAAEVPKVLSVLKALRGVLGEKPLLVTVRTREEGGEIALDAESYTALNAAAARSGDADAVDVQIFSGGGAESMNAVHAAGCRVVGSCHSFDKTPDKAEMIAWMRRAQDMGADIAKIAVMPHSTADVIALLDAAQEMHARYADRPIIAISMGGGVVSRLCGECFGSAATFGMVGQASAPGQIPADQLSAVLSVLHRALGRV